MRALPGDQSGNAGRGRDDRDSGRASRIGKNFPDFLPLSLCSVHARVSVNTRLSLTRTSLSQMVSLAPSPLHTHTVNRIHTDRFLPKGDRSHQKSRRARETARGGLQRRVRRIQQITSRRRRELESGESREGFEKRSSTASRKSPPGEPPIRPREVRRELRRRESRRSAKPRSTDWCARERRPMASINKDEADKMMR